MELAKPQVDLGIFTNRLEEMRTFYGTQLGLHQVDSLSQFLNWVEQRPRNSWTVQQFLL